MEKKINITKKKGEKSSCVPVVDMYAFMGFSHAIYEAGRQNYGTFYLGLVSLFVRAKLILAKD